MRGKKQVKKRAPSPKSEIRNPKPFDVVIIGAGAGGLSAASWCDELGLDALLLESGTEPGGQLLRVFNPIKNHLGAEAADGRRLRDIFVRQIEKRDFRLRFESEVVKADLKAKKVYLKTDEAFSAKFLIIATGVRRRRLNIAGEEKFKNGGIIESGTRDRDSAAGKRVLIVGGGDAALENALILAETAAEVFLVHRRRDFRGRAEFVEKVRAHRKVTILTETIVTKILGDETVEAVELENLATKEIIALPVQIVLVRIGVEPNTQLFRGQLNLNGAGYVEINSNCETSVENVFAVGDVANPLAPTVSSAVGMGATAVKAISSKLN